MLNLAYLYRFVNSPNIRRLKAVYQKLLTFQFPCFETETLDDFRTLILPRFKAYLFVSETPLETKTFISHFCCRYPTHRRGRGCCSDSQTVLTCI